MTPCTLTDLDASIIKQWKQIHYGISWDWQILYWCRAHEKQNRRCDGLSLLDFMGTTESNRDSQAKDTHYGQWGISNTQKRNTKELHNSISPTKQPQTKSSWKSNSNIQKPFQSSTCRCWWYIPNACMWQALTSDNYNPQPLMPIQFCTNNICITICQRKFWLQ